MKRNIITVDEDKCTGCGLCANGCPEGALQIIDGKARLVGELLCDGLGACIGTCPTGALQVEQCEAEAYDERKVMDNVMPQGGNVLRAHLRHLHEHKQKEHLATAIACLQEKGLPVPDYTVQETLACGCPGTMTRDMRNTKTAVPADGRVASELTQRPIQLALVSPHAPYFQNADLVVAADCTAFAFGDFHHKFLRNNALVVFCPKLDDRRESYVEKLSAIIRDNSLNSLAIVHMEVPCCFGTVKLVEEALALSGKQMMVKEYTVAVNGELV